ncbi:MAG: hypothetical protein DRP06_04045 [Candidatus Aenigmatarchaeota archaeon]|nr:MAG: hypothetical protein DRP06_04045 [Candidatus Aenigmarchaeota archaeon]
MFGGPLEILSFVIFIALMFFFPKIMLYQILSLLNTKAASYEEMTTKAQKMILKKIDKKTKLTNKQLKTSIDRMMETFVVEPDSIDPNGIAKKVRYITNRHDKKLDLFVKDITEGFSKEYQRNLAASITHTIGLYQITKIIKHFIELIKQTKNFQIGMVLQMQLPFIDKQMKALYSSIPALIESIPVGDCIGPLYAANIIGDSKTEKIAEGTIVAKKKIKGKEVFILKADGPGANLGNIDEAIRKIVAKNKIDKIITIDASGALESEKVGLVAEGVGFAMGPRGAERFFAETFLTDKNIPVDGVIVKMKPEQALMPMKKEIKEALPLVDEAVWRCMKEAKKKIIIVGVGLTVGVGNNKKAAEIAEKKIEVYNKKLEVESKKKKKKGFWAKIFGE